MSGDYDYRMWIHECQQVIRQSQINSRRRRRVMATLVVNEIAIENQKIKNRKKHSWVHPLYELQREHGLFEAVCPTLLSYSDKFENYIRMSAAQFEELLCLVGPRMSKAKGVTETISATARLVMTLRYLATGDCMILMSDQYLIDVTTTANIIAETCQDICYCLQEHVLPDPLTTTDWLKIAHDFDKQCEFPHCIGAIDGKHIQIQCPDDAGSTYSNDKHHHNIVLLGICDANYSFTYVDIGAKGRRSDGGILRDSPIGQKFAKGEMNVPKSVQLTVDGMPLPYVLVGDEAFQLTDYLLRPYPTRGGLTKDQSIFNYRLSRARKTIENSFGLLVSLWRILKKPIEATEDNTVYMVKAIICLHNWLCKRDHNNIYIPRDMVDQYEDDSFVPGLWRGVVGKNSALQDTKMYGNNFSARSAVTLRNEFCDYFSAEGAVPWQYNRT